MVSKEYIEKHPNYNIDTRKKVRQKSFDVVGNSCVICGSKENLILHEIHGKPHDASNIYKTLNNSKDFVAVCFRHHRLIHLIATIKDDKELERVLILSARITD